MSEHNTEHGRFVFRKQSETRDERRRELRSSRLCRSALNEKKKWEFFLFVCFRHLVVFRAIYSTEETENEIHTLTHWTLDCFAYLFHRGRHALARVFHDMPTTNEPTNTHENRAGTAPFVFLFFFGTTQWTNVKPLLMELLSLSSSSSHTHTRARTHRLSLFHWKKPRPLSVAKAPPLPFPARPGTPPTCPIKKKKKQINVEETNVVHFAHTQPHTR